MTATGDGSQTQVQSVSGGYGRHIHQAKPLYSPDPSLSVDYSE